MVIGSLQYKNFHLPCQRDNKKTVVSAAGICAPEQSTSSLAAVLKYQIQNRRFLLKKWKTEGVLKSPIFRDTAVSWRYRHVLFYPGSL